MKVSFEFAIFVLLFLDNIVQARAPANVVGDIHGQFHDLVELFKINGDPPQSNYVFLGDYVDRGYNSVETIELLMCLKLKFPDRIILIRGNHETKAVTSVYGFYDEIIRKYGNATVWKLITEQVFNCMPIAAIIHDQVFCVHGGLSPDAEVVDSIEMIDRFQEIPSSGPYWDLVWSDPEDLEQSWGISGRGAGFLFGQKATEKFNYVNQIGFICRAHQLVNEGYKYMFDNKLMTVWSAPNYWYRCGNKAIWLNFDDDLNKTINIFDAVPENKRAIPTQWLVPYFL